MLADFFFIGSKFAYNCYYYFNTWCVELEYGWIRNWNHRFMGLDLLGYKDIGFHVFRTLICIVGKPWSKQCI